MWHDSFIDAFDEIWQPKLELARKNGQITPKDYAQICFEIKHYLLEHIYSRMADTSGLALVQEKNYNEFEDRIIPSFEWLINYQMDMQKTGFAEQHRDRPFDPKPIEEGGDFDLGQAYRNTINLLTMSKYWEATLSNLGLTEYNSSFKQLIERNIEPLIPTMTANT